MCKFPATFHACGCVLLDNSSGDISFPADFSTGRSKGFLRLPLNVVAKHQFSTKSLDPVTLLVPDPEGYGHQFVHIFSDAPCPFGHCPLTDPSWYSEQDSAWVRDEALRAQEWARLEGLKNVLEWGRIRRVLVRCDSMEPEGKSGRAKEMYAMDRADMWLSRAENFFKAGRVVFFRVCVGVVEYWARRIGVSREELEGRLSDKMEMTRNDEMVGEDLANVESGEGEELEDGEIVEEPLENVHSRASNHWTKSVYVVQG